MIYLGCWTEGCPGYYVEAVFGTQEEADAWVGTFTDRFIVVIDGVKMELV